jgi:hypothetical protein
VLGGGGAGTRRFLPVLLLAAAALLVAARPGGAATVPVSTTAQLQSALQAAQGGDTIQLAPGVYAPDAPLDVPSGVAIQGPTVAGPEGGPSGAVILGSNLEGGDSSDVVTVGSGASATIKNVSIRLASSEGSAIVVDGTLDLEDSELTQNNSFSVVLVDHGGTLNAVNDTIAENLGGGVEVQGTANFVNATIVDNEVAGIYNQRGSDVSITNTIVADNGDGPTYRGDCYRAVKSVNSLDGDGNCDANLHGDPKLAALDMNGGTTATMALLPGSPAIDAGAPSACPTVDQRLAPRVGTCDLGAFEYGARVPAAPSGSTSSGATSGSQSGTQQATPSAAAGAGSSTAAAQGSTAGAAKGSKAASRLVATGKIRARVGKATFSLRAAVGEHTGLVSFQDPAAKVRLLTNRIASVTIARGGARATIRGAALNRANGRRVAFLITVRSGKPAGFSIMLGNGYSRTGPLLGGSVAIAP